MNLVVSRYQANLYVLEIRPGDYAIRLSRAVLLPRAQMGGKDGIATTGPTMDNEKDRVVLVVSPDRDPLVDAADPNGAFLDYTVLILDPL
jgi:hypothetical protein